MLYGYVVRQYHAPAGTGIQKPNKQTCMLHAEGNQYPNKLLSILRAQENPCVSRFVGVSKQQSMSISRECITAAAAHLPARYPTYINQPTPLSTRRRGRKNTTARLPLRKERSGKDRRQAASANPARTINSCATTSLFLMFYIRMAAYFEGEILYF
jgi:hypothetical protein